VLTAQNAVINTASVQIKTLTVAGLISGSQVRVLLHPL
jgi:hypothetical protein